MITRVHSAAYLGIQSYPVEIEVDVQAGLPQFTVVGLPDTSIRESRERVRSAIKNSGFRFPPERITVNLAPAHIRKEGPAFELPIALGILAATEVISAEKLREFVFLGELALDGTLRPFKGAMAIAEGLQNQLPAIFPEANAREAAFYEKATLYAANNLKEVIDFLRGDIRLSRTMPLRQSTPDLKKHHPIANLSDIKGQRFAKRALEIAASGGHNLLFIGSPGSGKTMLARRLPDILPPLPFDQALEVTKLYSVAGLSRNRTGITQDRPFRSPHHSISSVAMAGGGTWPLPGEISLAHAGVLFLDEFPEFRRDVVETLRAPLEEGSITICRAKGNLTYPCRLMLIAAMNPCPCGYLTDRRKPCRCSSVQIQKYQAKISGPILDRIDLHVEVPALTYGSLASEEPAESSEVVRQRVEACRHIQTARYPDRQFKVNAFMQPREIKKYAMPDSEGSKLIEMAMKELNLSARGYYKILKVARTIADMTEEENISSEHISEAIGYRTLDRQW
ncbi:MAG: YifB family Mg chelatase-like AAA ATPase [Candidatus Omnitrophota bacterium]|nr:YifB family Mg chelatase-like AAA ATPase [Candidatus Omnitrophota bacterium]